MCSVTLKKRLRELREAAGFSLRQAAMELNKSPGYLSRIEGRGEIPTPELICKMAGVYGVDAEELLELAKEATLQQTRSDIERRHGEALRLFRKDRKR